MSFTVSMCGPYSITSLSSSMSAVKIGAFTMLVLFIDSCDIPTLKHIKHNITNQHCQYHNIDDVTKFLLWVEIITIHPWTV